MLNKDLNQDHIKGHHDDVEWEGALKVGGSSCHSISKWNVVFCCINIYHIAILFNSFSKNNVSAFLNNSIVSISFHAK